ncbi:MAG TPA: site-specific integrase [Bryobacteraceae bacterium]|jgi:integrase|nr:site-specific integrase [Bryobacteraceae bacterium]
MKPMAVEDWLNGLAVAPKTKGHIRGLMHVIFDCAIRWELTDKNPMDLVRVKGGVQRLERPAVLTTEQFTSLLAEIREPFRTMVLVAGCLGLRVSEIVGLQWSDFDEKNSSLLIQRGVVHGRVGEVKTESSRDLVPIDPLLAEALLRHREQCYPTAEGWLFANPVTGRPYHQEEIQKRHIVKAATAVGITERVGWHTFRHSYRSWLDTGGASIGVQKELMRHASIQTTMNVYGRGAMTEGKRQANTNVVEMVLRKPQPQKRQSRKKAVASA